MKKEHLKKRGEKSTSLHAVVRATPGPSLGPSADERAHLALPGGFLAAPCLPILTILTFSHSQTLFSQAKGSICRKCCSIIHPGPYIPEAMLPIRLSYRCFRGTSIVNWTITCSNVPTYLCSTRYVLKTVKFSTQESPAPRTLFKFTCTRCSLDMHG